MRSWDFRVFKGHRVVLVKSLDLYLIIINAIVHLPYYIKASLNVCEALKPWSRVYVSWRFPGGFVTDLLTLILIPCSDNIRNIFITVLRNFKQHAFKTDNSFKAKLF